MSKINNMTDIFNEVKTLYSTKQSDYQYKDFIKEYKSKDISEIDWETLCTDAKESKATKYAFFTMYVLLKHNLYHGEYSEYLYCLLDDFDTLINNNSKLFSNIMCGSDIRFAYFYTTKSGFAIRFAKTKNTFLKKHHRNVHSEHI